MSWALVDFWLTPLLLWLGVGVLFWRGRRATPPVSRRRAVVYVLAGWAVVFGTATARSIRYLVDPFDARVVDSGRELLVAIVSEYLPTGLFAVLAVLAATRLVGTTPARVGLAWPAVNRRSRPEMAALTQPAWPRHRHTPVSRKRRLPLEGSSSPRPDWRSGLA